MKVLYVGLGHAYTAAAAVQQAMQSTSKPNLAIVFCASQMNPQEVYATIRQQVGENCAIIGGSTCGEFSSLDHAPQGGSVVVMTLQSSYMSKQRHSTLKAIVLFHQRSIGYRTLQSVEIQAVLQFLLKICSKIIKMM